ncbi:MAG: YdbL family protein [Thermodesulfobacteriota bacterium]
MRGQWKRGALFLPLVFVIISCVTINVYFPAAAVEKAADKLVDDVWGDPGEEQTPAVPAKDGAPDTEGRLNIYERLAALHLGARSAEAAEKADINVSTPAIRTLKKSIHSRAGAIRPYMDKGNIGIGSDGLLALRTGSGLNLKQKAAARRLVKAENKDRLALYREIAAANNISPDRVKDIQGLFAKSWIKNAKKGWWIQGANGGWAKK